MHCKYCGKRVTFIRPHDCRPPERKAKFPLDTTGRPELSQRDLRVIKTLQRRADFLESRVSTRDVLGLDLDKQEAACLRYVLSRAYPQISSGVVSAD